MTEQTQTCAPPVPPPPAPLPDTEPTPQPTRLIIGWRFGRGAATVNYLHDKLQLHFDFGQHPDDEEKRQLRKHGFHFAKSQGFAWQRPLDMKAVEAAADMRWLWPCSGVSPVDIQPDLPRRDLPPWAN